MNAVGRKTATIVNVVAITARPISSAASIAAWYGGLPAAMWRAMFSISTMASSTSTPITSDSASSVTVLRLKWNRYIAPNVGRMDSGNAVAQMAVERQSRRNQKTTTTASRAPSISSSIEPW